MDGFGSHLLPQAPPPLHLPHHHTPPHHPCTPLPPQPSSLFTPLPQPPLLATAHLLPLLIFLLTPTPISTHPPTSTPTSTIPTPISTPIWISIVQTPILTISTPTLMPPTPFSTLRPKMLISIPTLTLSTLTHTLPTPISTHSHKILTFTLIPTLFTHTPTTQIPTPPPKVNFQTLTPIFTISTPILTITHFSNPSRTSSLLIPILMNLFQVNPAPISTNSLILLLHTLFSTIPAQFPKISTPIPTHTYNLQTPILILTFLTPNCTLTHFPTLKLSPHLMVSLLLPIKVFLQAHLIPICTLNSNSQPSAKILLFHTHTLIWRPILHFQTPTPLLTPISPTPIHNQFLFWHFPIQMSPISPLTLLIPSLKLTPHHQFLPPPLLMIFFQAKPTPILANNPRLLILTPISTTPTPISMAPTPISRLIHKSLFLTPIRTIFTPICMIPLIPTPNLMLHHLFPLLPPLVILFQANLIPFHTPIPNSARPPLILLRTHLLAPPPLLLALPIHKTPISPTPTLYQPLSQLLLLQRSQIPPSHNRILPLRSQICLSLLILPPIYHPRPIRPISLFLTPIQPLFLLFTPLPTFNRPHNFQIFPFLLALTLI